MPTTKRPLAGAAFQKHLPCDCFRALGLVTPQEGSQGRCPVALFSSSASSGPHCAPAPTWLSASGLQGTVPGAVGLALWELEGRGERDVEVKGVTPAAEDFPLR